MKSNYKENYDCGFHEDLVDGIERVYLKHKPAIEEREDYQELRESFLDGDMMPGEYFKRADEIYQALPRTRVVKRIRTDSEISIESLEDEDIKEGYFER